MIYVSGKNYLLYIITFNSRKINKDSCITESFNMNISHQLFDYTLTFVNPQHALEHKFKG